MAEERPKINKYSLSDLKNTTDDAIPHYFTSLGYRQVHVLSDIRLAIGFSACAIAAGAFYYDFQVGFEASKTVMLYAVISYYVLNTLLTFWILWVETGAVYIGERNGLRIKISTHVGKHTPIYHMDIETSGEKVEGEKNVVKVKEPFTSWFDEQGYFVQKPLHKFLERSIPRIASPKPTVVVNKKKGKL